MTAPQRDLFKDRVRGWARRLDVEVATISVRPMSRKWASCSLNGNLSFSTELVEIGDLELADYVIVHELLHLQAPNHGRLWKSLMRAYLGDYEQLHRRLSASTARGEAA